MLKKSITYEDFNGNTTTEDFYFHLSKAELLQLKVSHKGGMQTFIERIVASEDGATIIREFRELILIAYGIRSDDGRRFIKTPELRQEFESTEAFSELFMELCIDSSAAAEFVNGIVPPNLESELERIKNKVRSERPHPSDPAATPMGRNIFETERDREFHVLISIEGIEPDGIFETGNDAPKVHPEADPTAIEPQRPVSVRILSRAEVAAMDMPDLKDGLATGRYQIAP